MESSTWQDTVLAWSERMAANYPLYVDILHPVRLALYETCYGIEQLRSAKGKQPHGDGGAVVDMVAAGLMAFPPVLGCSPAKGKQQQQQQNPSSGGPSAAWQPVPVSRLGDSSLQTVLGSLAKSSARTHQQPPVDDEQKQRQKDAQQASLQQQQPVPVAVHTPLIFSGKRYGTTRLIISCPKPCCRWLRTPESSRQCVRLSDLRLSRLSPQGATEPFRPF